VNVAVNIERGNALSDFNVRPDQTINGVKTINGVRSLIYAFTWSS